MKTVGVAAFAALVLTAGVVFTASKSDDDVVRQMRDRAQIEDLMWRYTRALDTGNGEVYASTYTPDGQFTSGSGTTKGREALRKMVGDARQSRTEAEAKGQPKRPPMYHMTMNSTITFVDADHARIDAYWIGATASGGADAPSRLTGAGRSVDDVVRMNGAWLIKSRNVAPAD